MKVREFIKKLENLEENLLDKEIFIRTRSGCRYQPEIKFELKSSIEFINKSRKNMNLIIIMEEK